MFWVRCKDLHWGNGKKSSGLTCSVCIYLRNSRTFVTKILYVSLGYVIYARKQFYINKSGYVGNFFKYCIKSVNYASKYAIYRVTRTRSCLRHWAASRKVAGPTPDCVTGIFHWHNPCGRTMSLGLTQLTAEMSTTNISYVVKAAVCGTDKLTQFMFRLSINLGASTSWKPLGLSRALMGLLYLYTGCPWRNG